VALAVAMADRAAWCWERAHDAVRLVDRRPAGRAAAARWPEWLGLSVRGPGRGVVSRGLPIALLLGSACRLFGIALLAASVLARRAGAGRRAAGAGRAAAAVAWLIRRRRTRRTAATIGA
jgi:hypothetical protein